MNLIAYSDSEESANEAPSAPKPAAKPASKPAFQKVVDRSKPGKIKLNLPGASRTQPEKDDIEAEAPPAKKARTGGGAFSGFNAMLPAPKKPAPSAAAGGATSGKRGLGKGLGAGVNLKTGAEPAFKREPKVAEDEYDENGNPVKKEPMQKEDFRALLNLPPPKTETKIESAPLQKPDLAQAEQPPEVKPAAKPKFVPMSVSRGKKKKPMVPRPAVAAPEEGKPGTASALKSSTGEPKGPAKPKVSLFSLSQDAEAPTRSQANGSYQPLLYGFEEEDDDDAARADGAFEAQTTHQTTQDASSVSQRTPGASNDLANIASELNLSEAERRQLFGRKGHGPDLSAAKITEFNTDTEYAHNEMLRQQGETVQHNALKSITGTGKNSLRSLVNVATTQKDALEEHFAQGRRNKKEAGNKYGW
ncbi:hypothetical protein BU26DRAFT_520022 [Trematosphaeria pertusa]|uniref:Mitotic checkpoint regulator, MAD2B-interacting-domain-containing protein n=1 Tax=Trematosphaeria pertusa TaxID=390896 RepID=A0A6A6IEI2_9PLEO|nr:uncharacterized protein BU26DRAFT_520022 [Trematosphaeria pertusa]KAF2248312.1 hypothetical protein BU26DRAFT_520022 [Trematosphaeria pertusa]